MGIVLAAEIVHTAREKEMFGLGKGKTYNGNRKIVDSQQKSALLKVIRGNVRIAIQAGQISSVMLATIRRQVGNLGKQDQPEGQKILFALTDAINDGTISLTGSDDGVDDFGSMVGKRRHV